MPFSVAGTIGTVRVGPTTYTQLHAAEDGNCLFHSIGYLLERLHIVDPLPTDHATLRTRACDKISALLTSVDTPAETKLACETHIYDAKGVTGGLPLAQATALTQYVIDMRRVDVAWGDLLCVFALELLYGVRIEVYHLDHAGASARANFPVNGGGGGVLRIVTPYTGRAGYYNHYNPLVSDPTLLEAAPAAIAEPAEKGLKDPTQWAFWSRKGLYLYQPPSCHFQYGDLWTAPVVQRGRAIFASNHSEHEIDEAKPTLARIVLHGPPNEADSVSFRANLDVATINDAFNEPWIFKLARDEAGRATAAIDVTDVVVNVDVTHFEAVESLTFRVFTRGVAEPVAAGVLLREVLLKKAGGVAHDQALSLPLSEVLTAEERAKLSYAGSPFRLVVCANGVPRQEGVGAAQWAFTYFHVPSPWDINTPEGVQAARVVPLQDDLRGLRKVKEATILARSAINDVAVKPPVGVGDTNDVSGRRTLGEMSIFLRSLGDRENPDYVPARHNIFWQLPDGTYYVASSWASILVLVLDKDGDYEAHSMLLHGGSLRMYIATLESQVTSQTVGDVRVTLLRALQSELQTLAFKKKRHDDSGYFTSARAAEKVLVVAQQAKVLLAANAIRNHPATLQWVQRTRADSILEDDLSTVDASIVKTSSIVSPLEREMEGRLKEFTAGVRQSSFTSIAGQNDFEGFRPGTHGGWDQYFLPPGMKITKAITQGISSCAGGVTFANDAKGRPSAIILWHIDFPPWVPIKEIVQQLWPEPKECPDLRTVAFVYPDCAELNKYRPAMIYPEPIRDRCETVFMTRGDHLGVEDFSLGSGGEYFGLDLADRGHADLVFTHDLNKRTEMVGKRAATPGDADTSITLNAFHQDVFGRYRYEAIEVKGHDRAAMRLYATKVAKTDDDEVKVHKLTKCSVVRLAGVGPELFEAMKAASTPVLEAPCFMLGLRVEQEFAGATPEIQAGRAWRTGHQDRGPKVKVKVKEVEKEKAASGKVEVDPSLV
jgi:hypothetical protein